MRRFLSVVLFYFSGGGDSSVSPPSYKQEVSLSFLAIKQEALHLFTYLKRFTCPASLWNLLPYAFMYAWR